MVHTEDRVDPVADLEIIHHELRLKVTPPPLSWAPAGALRICCSCAPIFTWRSRCCIDDLPRLLRWHVKSAAPSGRRLNLTL